MSDLTLRRLAIRAYRSIARADLRMGRITVVIGPSDSGKTNLVRALRDWGFNASGYDFITEGQSVCRVAVALGPSKRIVFEKETTGKGGTSRYVLDDAETGERLSFEKIGLTVPEEIVSLTDVRELTVDDLKLKIQFAEQAEPWFLLSPSVWTPGKVNKVIGRISGVDSLLLATRDLNARRASYKRDVKETEARIADAEERLREFEGLDALAGKVEEAAELDASIADRRSRVSRASTLVREVVAMKVRLRAVTRRREALEGALAEGGSGDLLGRLESYERAVALDEEAERLRGKLLASGRRVEELKGELAKLRRELKRAAKDAVCPVCGEPAHEGCLEALERRASEADA